ncbi:hypothetical protein EDC04DRAFT_3148964, partial [Pisolithus marmoratus]
MSRDITCGNIGAKLKHVSFTCRSLATASTISCVIVMTTHLRYVQQPHASLTLKFIEWAISASVHRTTTCDMALPLGLEMVITLRMEVRALCAPGCISVKSGRNRSVG